MNAHLKQVLEPNDKCNMVKTGKEEL